MEYTGMQNIQSYYSRVRNAHLLRIPYEHDSGVRGDFAQQTFNIALIIPIDTN